MSRFNLNPDQELVKSFGTLAYVSEEERKRYLSLPSGQFKPSIKELTKELRAAQKQEAQRRKEEARKLRATTGWNP